MDIIEIIGILISAAATIICAYIARSSDKRAKSAEANREVVERRTQQRIKESMLSLKLMNANCALTVGTALAIKRGKTNGEMEEGLKAVEAAQKEYEEFMRQIALENMTNSDTY